MSTQPPGAEQTFGLGTLVGPQGTSAPARATVEIEGRGIFAKVKILFEFEFESDQAGAERLFLMEKPWDAVASVISINGQPLTQGAAEPGSKALPPSQLTAVQEAASVPSSHLMVVEIGRATELSTIAFEFVLAADLQWHRGAFIFRSPEGTRSLAFSGRWELSGLPGAGIAFTRAASPCRLETLEGARHRWSEPLTVTAEEPAVMQFSLDEKKAASIAVYSPTPEGAGPGCAAVAVVAPVRPQLARESVRLAILLEVRNPQEGLLMRAMVDKAVSLLKGQDEFSVLLVGTDTPSCLVPWSSSEAINDEVLAKVLEPTVIGKSPDLWANLAALAPNLRTATHLLIGTSGAPTYPGKGLVANTPVFVFATGRRPFKSQLESLSQRSNGFLMEGTMEGLESLAERMRIRLSPPLLSDFKLEGWPLSQLRPAGATQVYTDQPTLVFGLYEGLLPKTVTLSGQSPARQKLAQRVKVESMDEINLMPLYTDRVARWDGEAEPVHRWQGEGVAVCNISHAETIPTHYVAKASNKALATTMVMGVGGPPTLSLSHSAVTLDNDSLMGAPAMEDDGFFSEEKTMRLDGAAAFEGVAEPFEGVAEPDTAESDLFFTGAAPHDSLMGGPVQIRKAPPEEDFSDGGAEADLFEDPSVITNRQSFPEAADESFELPSGPPTIYKDSGESVDAAPAPRRQAKADKPAEAPAEDANARRKLLSWRQRQEAEGAQSGAATEAPVPVARVRTASPGWTSEWLESFSAMEPSVAAHWLESCSIDHLGLAASLMEPEVANDILARLSPLRQRAVRNQMEFGRLLESYECEEADHQLAISLTQASL